jgi:hypothetical protein
MLSAPSSNLIWSFSVEKLTEASATPASFLTARSEAAAQAAQVMPFIFSTVRVISMLLASLS